MKGKDITGQKFNRLKVIKSEWRNSKSGHKQKGWVCQCECGNIKWHLTYDLTSGKIKSCGCYNKEIAKERMTGPNNLYWKGGKGSINKKGYREIRHGEDRGKLEHRLVWERHYNVKLKPHQNIHHINGDRKDNRIENLELWDTSQPPGQRVEDKIKFYQELMEEYKDHPLYKELINKTSYFPSPDAKID